MNIFRNDKKLKLSNNGKFIFQALEWTAYDHVEEDDESDSDSSDDEGYGKRYKKQKDGKYLIRAYGVTAKSNSVCLTIHNFTPYFFIKVPQYWQKDEVRRVVQFIDNEIAAKYEGSIKSADIVERKEFYGFTNNKKFKFLRLVFQSQACMRAVSRIFERPVRIPAITSKPLFLRLYESNIDPLVRFIHCQNLNPSGWIELKSKKFNIEEYKQTNCQIEISAYWQDVLFHDKQDIAPLVIASFDIECTSSDGSFPKAERLGDKVIQIGTTIHRFGEKECFLKHMITLGKCDPIDGVMVESYDTEEEVLLAWTKFIVRLDPDIITGYNIWGFDFKYLYQRAKLFEIESRFSQLGRLKDKEGKMIEKQLQSSALGQNFLYILETEGRVQIDLMKLVQKDYKLDMYKLDFVANHFLKSNKVDLSPKELFKKFREGSSQSIRDIAVYCVQDCELCNKLIDKLDVITGNIGMSNVCFVPFSWLFTRGQGVKIFSLVAKQCRKEGFLIKVVKKEEDDGSYEGAIVLVATPGIYLKPISVTDYASLYPSSMISENISHDSIVWIKVLDKEGTLLSEWGNKEYYDLPDYNYNEIEYDNFVGQGDKKEITGKTICCFAEHKDGSKNAIPRILDTLLFARRQTRASIKYSDVYLTDGTRTCGDVSEKDGKVYVTKYKEKSEIFDKSEVKEIKQKYNPFQQNVLDGLQLAYKITANSLYGQIGAKTSPICFKELAACTTATGRSLLRFARDHTEKMYPGAVCVYGDTDSIFVDFTPYMKDVLGLDLKGKEALKKSIELGIEAGEEVTRHLKKPHDLEYEKTFYPFVQLAKKRYVGNLYGTSTEKFYQNSMGIVLKRRDNAQICKKIYGGIIHIILNEQDVQKAIEFFIKSVKDLLEGKEDLQNLVITKTLRAEYKSPESIAHKVLADRMAERDPGNKPQSNDRIPFVYIQTKEKKGAKVLQGDKVEHPEYIKQNSHIKPDFRYYLDHQVKVPCIQLFALVLEEMPGYNPNWLDQSIIRKLKEKGKSEKEIEEKISDLREKEAEKLLLGEILRIDDNQRKGNSMITDFFVKRKKTDVDDGIDDCFDGVRDQWQEMMSKRKDKDGVLKVKRQTKTKQQVSLDDLKKAANKRELETEDEKLQDKIIQPDRDALKRVAQIRERKKQEKKEEREKKKAEKKKEQEEEGEKKPVRRTRRKVVEKTI
jgi:DNA polymerase delta subunit 1